MSERGAAPIELKKQAELENKIRREKEWIEKGRELFRKDHPDIIERYATELPAPEPCLRLVIVVPAYRELDNNNFWRLLRSAVKQRVSNGTFEILYVVNNRQEQESERTAAFEENQRTLRLLQVLQMAVSEKHAGQDVSDILRSIKDTLDQIGCSEWEHRVLKQAVEAEVRMYAIDASTADKALDPVFNPRGRARNIGVHIAYERLKHTLAGTKDGFVDFLDADCFMTPNYVETLLKPHKAQRLLLKTLVAQSPEMAEYVEQENDPLEKLIGLIQYLRIAMLDGRVRYLLTTIGTDMADRLGHGPSITVQARLLEDAGGYPQYGDNEDFSLYAILQKLVSPEEVCDTGVRIHLSHRTREEAVDGRSIGHFDPVSVSLADYLQHLSRPLFGDLDSSPFEGLVMRLLTENDKYKDDPRYRQIRAEAFRLENIQRRVGLKALRKMVHHLAERIQTAKKQTPSDQLDFHNDHSWLDAGLPDQQRDMDWTPYTRHTSHGGENIPRIWQNTLI